MLRDTDRNHRCFEPRRSKNWRKAEPMKVARTQRALVACCLVLPTVLGACADANPSPTTVAPALSSPTAVPTSTVAGEAPRPGGGKVIEASPPGASAASAFQPGPC